MRTTPSLGLLLLLLAGCATGPVDSPGAITRIGASWSEEDQENDRREEAVDEEEESSVGEALLLYLPNRVFDLLDILRARLRLGPGWSFSIRPTELLDLNMGAHATVFLGLRGPRHQPRIPWPFGLETFEGLEASLADSTNEAGPNGPDYGPLEVGLGLQVLIVGADLGVPIMEIVDLVAGLVFLDPMEDDY